MTYPITVEIINKANNEVLLQRTTTTSNIAFSFKAPITGAAEVKIYLRNPVTGTVPEYNLTYAKLSKAAYNFPASVPASEMEVVSNFNIGDRADQDLFDLPINNAGWLVNPSSSIIAVQEQVNNNKIAVVNNSTTQTVTSISKTLTLGTGTYNLSFREFRQALSPYWAQLGSTESPNTGTFSNSHSLILTISGSDITTGAGSETYEITDIQDIEQAFTLNKACDVPITITSNTKNLAFEYLTLTKTVLAATTPETNGWASNYRYGFNGKENMKEAYSMGVLQDYGFRLYNSHIARFLSVDPLRHQYPELTTYQFASNTPLQAIDLDGLEAVFVTFVKKFEGFNLALDLLKKSGLWAELHKEFRTNNIGYDVYFAPAEMTDSKNHHGQTKNLTPLKMDVDRYKKNPDQLYEYTYISLMKEIGANKLPKISEGRKLERKIPIVIFLNIDDIKMAAEDPKVAVRLAATIAHEMYHAQKMAKGIIDEKRLGQDHVEYFNDTTMYDTYSSPESNLSKLKEKSRAYNNLKRLEKAASL